MKKVFRKKSKSVFWLIVLLFLGLTYGCGKQKSHTYRIINNSNYDISQLTFSGAMNGEELSINANDTSQLITLLYESRVRLTPKLICISIDDFLGSSSFNTILNRPCVPFSNKDLNNTVNTIVITSDQNVDSITFNINLN
jgi:hypothetical protein